MKADLRFVLVKEPIAFSIGTGAVLSAIACVANGVAAVQAGPLWETPAAAEGNYVVFGVLSIVLCTVGIICYFWGNRFESLSPASRKAFRILFCAGLLVTLVGYVPEPEQWAVRHKNLSIAVRESAGPVSVLCGITWILLTVWIRRNLSTGCNGKPEVIEHA